MADIVLQATSTVRSAQSKLNELEKTIARLNQEAQNHKQRYKQLKQNAVKEVVDDEHLADAATTRMQAEKEKTNSYEKKTKIKTLKRQKSKLKSDVKVLNRALSRAQSANSKLQSAVQKVQGRI